ncbi:MAG: hypothetical protein NVSMB13_16710 [Mycobacteriales bacterium]
MSRLPLLILAAAVVLVVVVVVILLVTRVRSGSEVDRFHRARSMTTAWSQSDWQRRVPGSRAASEDRPTPPDPAAQPGAATGPETRAAAPRARTE